MTRPYRKHIRPDRKAAFARLKNLTDPPTPRNEPGETIALMFNGPFTPEQFRATIELLWAIYPAGWPDGKTLTLPNGTEVRIVKSR